MCAGPGPGRSLCGVPEPDRLAIPEKADARRHDQITAVVVGGSLDRAFVAEQVFNDKELLDALNAIIHPEVGRDFTIWCDKQQSPYVIKEAAILFESGSYLGCDQVILVTADLEMRIERIIRRDGTDREHILARMSNQWSDQRKSELADFIIENNDLASTRAQVEQIHAQLLQAAQ